MPNDNFNQPFQQFQQGYYPQIVTTAGSNVYVQPNAQQVVASPSEPEPERAPLEWLRHEVGEVCELARAA